VAFLRGQLDTIVAQLAKAEGAVKDYRERNLVVAPEAEATSQVTRLVSLQAERTTLEGERGALAKLLEDVDAKAAARRPGEPSPYRQLLAFPTLLRSQAAADLLSTLSAVEQERTILLVRRTPQDPDVKALDDRVRELEGQLRSVVAAYLQGLSHQIATLNVGLQQFGAQLGRLPQKEFEVARLERQPKVLEEIYTLLQTRLKEAEIAQAVEDPSVSLVDPAIQPRHPFKPRPLLNLTAGVLGGLVVGVLLALLLELRDKAVRSRADVRLATGLPLLGLIPHLPRSRGAVPLFVERRALTKPRGPTRSKPKLETPQYVPPSQLRPAYTFFQDGASELEPAPKIEHTVEPEPGVTQIVPVLHLAVADTGRHVAEAYAILQTNILFARRDDESKILVLTSPLPGDGKTTTAVNLAVALARGGFSVLVIDADLRRGMVHSAFNIDRAPGLSDVLRGSVPFARARVSVNVEGHELHVLTSGSSISNSTVLLGSDELRALLEQVRERYDTVIFDTPPTNVVTDASLLAAQADGVMLVARAGVTETGALGLAAEQLRHVRAPLVGVIMNDINFKRDASYDGAYRYYDYKQYVGSQG
jgi:capsular exopolysaccharide synthesis family protein